MTNGKTQPLEKVVSKLLEKINSDRTVKNCLRNQMDRQEFYQRIREIKQEILNECSSKENSLSKEEIRKILWTMKLYKKGLDNHASKVFNNLLKKLKGMTE